MTDVLCLGILVADVVARPVVEAPRGGGLAAVEQIGLFPGGCAVNTATALARIGIRVGVAGKLGSDALADFLTVELERAGIATRGVLRDPASPTSASAILVEPSGERNILHSVGANGAYRASDFDPSLLDGVRILHVAGAGLLPALDGPELGDLLKSARERDIATTADTAWDLTGRWRITLEASLPHLDLFMPSEAEARELAGTADVDAQIRTFRAWGARSVIVKQGARGCTGEDAAGARFQIPALPARVVDATGAGDCFAAGVVAGLLRHWPLEQAARLGTALGAAAVEGVGATTGVGSFETMVRRAGISSEAAV